MSPNYHHRSLPDALRAATAELVSERGPTGFSLREVARRAGVSHAAPQHHFGSAKGLLTSVAIEGFTHLGEAFEEAVSGGNDAADELSRLGTAYVRTALRYRGHFGVMMQDELVDGMSEDFQLASNRAYGYLVGVVTKIRDEMNPELDIDAAAWLCWSSMHGLVELAPKLEIMAGWHSTSPLPLDETSARFSNLLINGFRQS